MAAFAIGEHNVATAIRKLTQESWGIRTIDDAVVEYYRSAEQPIDPTVAHLLNEAERSIAAARAQLASAEAFVLSAAIHVERG